jgi:precorrin-6A/cobalt-precorrin-6A reductase
VTDRILILGGTAEAAELARRLAAREAAPEVITSLSGILGAPVDLPGPVRMGGFGGAGGLGRFIQERGIDRLVDATHPFATVISRHARLACEEAGIPRLILCREDWKPGAGDHWIEVRSLEEAAHRLPEVGRRALLTIGSKGIDAFAGVTGVHFVVRLMQVPAKPLPLADAEMLVSRPPFTEDAERALMTDRRIDVVVTKRSGGGATVAKLAAARALGIPVIAVERPKRELGPLAETVDDALRWLDAAATAETVPTAPSETTP